MRQPRTLAFTFFTLTPRHPSGHRRLLALASLGALVAAACGGEDTTRMVGEATAVEEALPSAGAAAGAGTASTDPGSEQPEPVAPSAGPLYAIATQLFSADSPSSTSYVRVLPSLDVGEIDLDAAREYNGRASVGTVGEWLFVMDGEQPIIDRFSVSADGTLTLEAQLSFANYGMPYWSIAPWGNTMVSPTKAYFSNPADGSLIVWNPTTMQIVGEIPLPVAAAPELELQASPAHLRGDRLFILFSWANFDTFEFSSVPQQLAVYDTTSDQILRVVEETRCPAIYSAPFEDEAGDLYFSNHVWSPMETLVKGAPQSCSLRVPAGEEAFDPTWQLRYADVAEGREGAVLRYLGDGRALADIFHDERATIDGETDPSELGESSNWRLWNVDLRAGTGSPVEGLEFKPGGYNDVHVGGRSFILMPSADYARTTAYELVDGNALGRFAVQGLASHMVELAL